jgi:hypothetical protein
MAISVRKHLDSATIHLPEAAPLVGKDVTIIVVEASSVSPSGSRRDMSALDRIAGKIELDYDAIEDLRRRKV